ncbi:hypothetical protein B0H13DRAFT_1875559 [Mycena leptocephala]|nr:hypothetical protein B0H13DRAFT_1875559 [Mycena leptocephala]
MLVTRALSRVTGLLRQDYRLELRTRELASRLDPSTIEDYSRRVVLQVSSCEKPLAPKPYRFTVVDAQGSSSSKMETCCLASKSPTLIACKPTREHGRTRAGLVLCSTNNYNSWQPNLGRNAPADRFDSAGDDLKWSRPSRWLDLRQKTLRNPFPFFYSGSTSAVVSLFSLRSRCERSDLLRAGDDRSYHSLSDRSSPRGAIIGIAAITNSPVFKDDGRNPSLPTHRHATQERQESRRIPPRKWRSRWGPSFLPRLSAPGVGAPTRSRRKTAAAPPAAGTSKSKAVDKPAAASGSRGSNPAGAKKKTTAGASAKSDGAAAGKAKASESPSKSTPLEKPAVVDSGGTHGDESDVPPLWSVSNSSESESSIEEKRFTMPGFSAMPVNRQDFEEALGRAAASVTPSLASLVQPSASVPGEAFESAHSTSTANPQGKGVIETDSVSHILKPVIGDERVFMSICAGIDIFDEEIGSSLLKYHPARQQKKPSCSET